MHPLISIITVSFNSEKYIEKTIKSVAEQNFTNREHIIIDGGSTDSTVDIIKKYSDKLAFWVSEPDSGIAEAMNKGIREAKGDYLLFLNSDDYLIDNDALNDVAEIIDGNHDLYIFRVSFLYPDGRQIRSLNHGFGLLTNFKMGSCHQGQFFSRSTINALGGFDTSLKINFDYDLLLRAYRNGATSSENERVVSVMRQVGISSRRDWTGFKERYDEEKQVHVKNTDSRLMYMAYKIYWGVYMPYRYLRYLLIAFNRKFLKNKTIKALQ